MGGPARPPHSDPTKVAVEPGTAIVVTVPFRRPEEAKIHGSIKGASRDGPRWVNPVHDGIKGPPWDIESNERTVRGFSVNRRRRSVHKRRSRQREPQTRAPPAQAITHRAYAVSHDFLPV